MGTPSVLTSISAIIVDSLSAGLFSHQFHHCLANSGRRTDRVSSVNVPCSRMNHLTVYSGTVPEEPYGEC